jgi:thiol-disulfide isomerase/thioredoxin
MIDFKNRRHLLTAGVAVGATLVGAGLGWRHFAPIHIDPVNLDRFWQAQLERPDGTLQDMGRLLGQPLVVNFWATWCPPCVEEMPLLERFYQKNVANGWQVLGIAIDQPSQVKRFLEQNTIKYPVVLGGILGSDLLRFLDNEQGSLPFTLVFDEHGQPIFSKLGKLSEIEINSWI